MELRSLENVRECVKGGLDKGPTQLRFYFLDVEVWRLLRSTGRKILRNLMVKARDRTAQLCSLYFIYIDCFGLDAIIDTLQNTRFISTKSQAHIPQPQAATAPKAAPSAEQKSARIV